MSASTSGALKALIESLGLSLSAYRDRAPTTEVDGVTIPAARPNVTISEALSITDDGHGRDADAVTELVQVDLWQRLDGAENYSGRSTDPVESLTLADALRNGLHGAQLSTAPTRAYGVVVDQMVRLVEDDTGIVHHALTVRIRRNA